MSIFRRIREWWSPTPRVWVTPSTSLAAVLAALPPGGATAAMLLCPWDGIEERFTVYVWVDVEADESGRWVFTLRGLKQATESEDGWTPDDAERHVRGLIHDVLCIHRHELHAYLGSCGVYCGPRQRGGQ